ncbi:Thyroid adenoma-associated protein [Larimichthys crocea]|uniref:Uncharacterized protein n=1 Tax=Larimichthys crocea TaxID=215358 RepID=A0ACD3QDH0_LARCR|nr:Thyroid adenoma-associated protein [Larimichthys crocea]
MVVKKKTAKVEAVVLDEEKLQKLIASLSVDGAEDGVRQLAHTLQSCLELTEPVQQIQLVKKAGSQLESLSEEQPDGALLDACLHTLSLVYTSLQAKNPLRRAIASALGSVPAWLQERTVNGLSACLSDCLSNPASDQYPHVVDTVTACLDGFTLGERCINKLLPEVLQFLHKGLSEYLHQNSGLAGRHIAQAQLMQSCLAAVKTSMLVIQRSQETISTALQAEQNDCKLEETLSSLLGCYIHILTDEEFIQSVQSTAGMAVVLLIRSVMGCGDEVASVVCSLLCSSAQGLDSAPQWLKQRCEGLCTSGRPPGVSLYLCHGALAMLSWKGALAGPQWERLLLLVPNTLLDLDVSIKESSTAMVVARVLTLWSSAGLDCLQGGGQPCSPHLQQSLCGGSELQRHLLEHIYSHWEHPLDGVRHQTRSLFRNLLLLHQHTNPSTSHPTEDSYITELTQSLLGLEWHMRGKYGSLGCLVELYGARYLLDIQPELPSCLLGLMGDQTLAPYASDLLERLFVSHKAQLASEAGEADKIATEDWMECWHRTWVTPLLQVLCRARLDQTTYILDYFLPKLLRCSPSSLAHMVQALQDTPPCSTGPSGSRGALGALMTCLRAARAQGVIPSSEEGLWGGLVPLSLLQQALIHKHDQVRMDALGLVCESHRSTEVLSVQEMDLIRHFLLPNLNSQSPGVRQQTVSLLKKLLCRMKDSTMLLQKRLIQERDQEQRDRDQHTIHLYKVQERMRCVLQAALDLSTSTKPFDSVSAAHLLNLLLHQPDLSQALLHCAQQQGLDFQPPSPPPSQPSDAVILEINTLAVVQFLLHSLQLEVSRAESSLLQAAASYPLYGRAHCITAVLQHLNTESLRQTEQWRGLVSELIAVCYRMSDVVSPVVQSSSPEGLIPMDNDSETSAGLQRILQEIQPRDTNDFFMSARELDTQPGDDHAQTQKIHTPSLDTGGEGYRVTAQMVLVCCWRSMKEVAMLLGQLCQSLPLHYTNDNSHTHPGLITEAQTDTIRPNIKPYKTVRIILTDTTEMDLIMMSQPQCPEEIIDGDIMDTMLPAVRKGVGLDNAAQRLTDHLWSYVTGRGLYFRQQLLQSRHRGAFELAYVGFVRLTDMLCRTGVHHLEPSGRPTETYRHEKNEPADNRPPLPLNTDIKTKHDRVHVLSQQLKSGLALSCGNGYEALLSSEPKSSSCGLLKMTMRELIALAMPSIDRNTDSSTVPQVHALNILRALYRDTRLGENIIPFVSDGMQAAVLGFTSPVWAVRNSSTLLFSTLITRIFGVKKGKDEHSKKNRMTGREFFTRFPALYPFLLNQLEEAAATVERQNSCVVTRGAFLDVLVCLCGPKISLLHNSEVGDLRQEALSILMASDLVTSDIPSTPLGPGSTQYLLSLARVALSASVELPELWYGAQPASHLLQCLLRCPQYEGASAVACLAQWVALVCSCCSEEQPVEVKLTAAKVLVNCTATVLSSPHLPLGLSTTVSLWKSLFKLLQDEDQEVRDSASDFISVPAPLLSTDVAGVSVCPPVALDSGVGLLCRLFELWGHVPEGTLALTEWLLGEEEGSDGTVADEASSLDEEDFLFEKGDLNLWAEPVQWVKLLHRHLGSLLLPFKQGTGPDQLHQIRTLSTQAQAKALSSQQVLDSLPALPQFSCTMEHARLVLRHQRATLALDVLERLR